MKGKNRTTEKLAPVVVALLSVNSFFPLLAEAAQSTGGTGTGAASTSPGSGGGAAQPSMNGEPITMNPPEQITPDSEEQHNRNKTISARQLSLHSAIAVHSFKIVRQEIGYDQPITLEQALKYALQNNLSIKVAKESFNYQRFGLLGNAASLLPSFSLSYNLTRTDIQNEHVYSLTRAQTERVNFPVFQGGGIVYSLLAQAFRTRGWFMGYKAGLNDALLLVYQNYHNLLLARTLLQIRAKAVEVDEEQLRVNQQLEANGTGTRFAVLQSDAQLAADRQAFIQQQVAVRQASLALNYALNCPMLVNLIPVDETITEQSLFQTNSKISDIVKVAVKMRPELRQYEMFKFGAERNLQVAAAPLYPQLAFYTAVSYTNTTSTTSQPSASSSSSSSDTAGAGVFGGVFRTFQEGMGLTWTLNGLGLTNVSNIFGAQSTNRQAGIMLNQQLQQVLLQVRSDYLTWRAAREQIDNAAHGAVSSAEEMRLAVIRLREGVGTNLELITAQKDYINALTNQAQAIVGSNLAQAQLLHDTGLISVDTLLHGYRGNMD